jgi:hypothetical protein
MKPPVPRLNRIHPAGADEQGGEYEKEEEGAMNIVVTLESSGDVYELEDAVVVAHTSPNHYPAQQSLVWDRSYGWFTGRLSDDWSELNDAFCEYEDSAYRFLALYALDIVNYEDEEDRNAMREAIASLNLKHLTNNCDAHNSYFLVNEYALFNDEEAYLVAKRFTERDISWDELYSTDDDVYVVVHKTRREGVLWTAESVTIRDALCIVRDADWVDEDERRRLKQLTKKQNVTISEDDRFTPYDKEAWI